MEAVFLERREKRGEVGGANLHIGRERTCRTSYENETAHTSYQNDVHILPKSMGQPNTIKVLGG